MTDSNSHTRPTSHRVGRFFYRALWWALTPGLGTYLRRRAKRGKEDLARLNERYGRPSQNRGDYQIVWVHGASVGESLSALPIIEHILSENQNARVLVTSGTVTSAQILSERLPARAFHQYVPLDHPAYVKRFLSFWQPTAVLWLESEFWPNLIVEAGKRRIPMALVNARVSDASFESWRRNRWVIEPILKSFRVSLAQDSDVAHKLAALGATNITTIGNLKYAGAELPVDQEKLKDLKPTTTHRPVWIAAQTIAPEEDMVLRTHKALAAKIPNLLTIIAPRHPERSTEIEERIGSEELRFATRSKGEKIDGHTEIYLADTMGELGLFFRLIPIVFLGRSLVPLGGGSNLLEPARLGCSVVQGPFTENFNEITERFTDADAIVIAASESELVERLAAMFEDPERARSLGAKAQAIAEDAASVLDRVIDAVVPLLPKPEAPHARS